MGHMPVPWMVDASSAKHTARVGRLLSYMAFGGQEGIVGQDSCRVLPLSTPGNKVRVMPGPYGILCRTTGYPNQMYAGMVDDADEVAITPTGASSGRSDLIVARVENPIGGELWTPPSASDGPYVYSRPIEGVPAGTTKASQLGLPDSMVALARLDIPASTATITGSMIKDLRPQASFKGLERPEPNEDPAVLAQPYYVGSKSGTGRLGASTISGDNLPYSAQAYRTWPQSGIVRIPFPSWATHVDITCQIFNIHNADGNGYGDVRLMLTGNGVTDYTTYAVFDNNGITSGNGIRCQLAVGGQYYITPLGRGRTWTFTPQARFYSNAGSAAKLYFDQSSYIWYFLNFKQHPTL